MISLHVMDTDAKTDCAYAAPGDTCNARSALVVVCAMASLLPGVMCVAIVLARNDAFLGTGALVSLLCAMTIMPCVCAAIAVHVYGLNLVRAWTVEQARTVFVCRVGYTLAACAAGAAYVPIVVATMHIDAASWVVEVAQNACLLWGVAITVGYIVGFFVVYCRDTLGEKCVEDAPCK